MKAITFAQILFSCFFSYTTLQTMGTTFQSATPLLPEPRFARKNLNTLELTLSKNKAKHSYNSFGQTTALLNFNGPENLLKRFTDSTLADNDTQTFGQAILSGEYSSLNCRLSIAQNFGPHFFINGITSLNSEKIQKFKIQPIKNNCLFVTQEEIDAQPDFKIYLEQIQKLLTFQDIALEATNDLVGPSFITLGFTNSFDNFVHLDFIDITIQTGVSIPEKNLEKNTATLQALPFVRTVNIGIPIQISCALGVYNWLNIGATGLIIPYFGSDEIIPLNTAATKNNILFSQKDLCFVHHKPLVYANAYIQADQIIPHLSFLCAVCYAQQYKTCYQSFNQDKFPNDLINKYPLHKPWEIINLTLSGELDLANQEHIRYFPRIKFIYIHPVWGKSIFKTDTIAGQLGLEIIFDF